jgi:hypothetical protein
MTTSESSVDTADRRGHDEPPFKIAVGEQRYEVNHRFRTGIELKVLAGIPLQNQLFLEVPGPGEDDQIRDDFSVPMQDGLHFYDVPVGNLGCS